MTPATAALPSPWPVRASRVGVASGVYLSTALLSLWLSASGPTIAMFWVCNAVGVCTLLAWPRRDTLLLLAGIVAANLAANLVFGRSAGPALAFALVNGAEMALAATLLRRVLPAGSAVDEPAVLVRLLVAGALPPAVAGATLAAAVMRGLLGLGATELWAGWLLSSALGGVTVLPLGLLLVQRGWRVLRLSAAEGAAMLVLLLLAGAAVVVLPHPFLPVSVLLVTAAATLRYPVVVLCVVAASLAISIAHLPGLALPGAHAEIPLQSADAIGSVVQALMQAMVLVPALLLAAQRARSGELQARFDAHYTRATEGIVLGRPDGSVTALNPAATAMLCGDESALRRLGRGGVVDLDDSRLPALLATRQRDGTATGGLRFRRLDGSTFETEVSSALYALPSGETVAHTFFRDISERVTQQRAVQAGHDLLQRLSAMVPGVLCTFEMAADGRMRMPWASAALPAVLGVSHAEVAEGADPLWRNCHPDDAPRLRDAIRASARDGTLLSQEVRFRVPGRELSWIGVQGQPQRQADGSTLWHGYIADINERRLDEEARRQQQRRTELAELAGGIGTWDADTRSGANITNDRWYDMLGYTRAELPATVDSFRSLVHPDDVAAVVGPERWKLAVDGTVAPPLVVRLRHKDGSWRWIEVRSMITERDPVSGAVLRISGTHIDVSERVQADALRIERDRAEAANQAKSMFMSRMSHELRTPLNAVLGFAQLLESDPEGRLSDTQQGQVAQVLGASDHLLSLINDLLDLARIEAGELQMLIEAVDVGSALRLALGAVDTQAQQRGITLGAGPVPAGLAVRADRRRLHQALLNLLSNGIKYNHPQGSVRLEVRVADTGGPHGAAVITVYDTGPGLSALQLAHLFEPFNRLGAEAGPVEGTGIGLTITRRLLDSMGGRIEVHSTVGQGSTFSVTLPLAPAAADSPAPTPAAEAQAAVADAPGRRLTVLYVEDNPVNVVLVEQMSLKRPQVLLRVAENGHDALAAATAQPPDLLLIDMNLGDMTGLDLREQLKADPVTAGIPCVVLSADALPSQVEAAMAAGFAEYLTKPLKMSVLLALYDRYLQRGAG